MKKLKKYQKIDGGLRKIGVQKNSTDMNPLVSVVTVVFNGVKHLEQTILSVLGQSYSNIEYIIIDGGSSDGSIELIKKYENKIDYWVSEKDHGIYDAMNKGIRLCNGKLIGLINSDDYYHKDAVKNVINSSCRVPGDIYYGAKIMIDSNNHIIRKVEIEVPKCLKAPMPNIVHPTVFVEGNVYDKIKFNPKFKIAGDYEFMLNCFIAKKKFVKIEIVIAYMRLGGKSSKFNFEGTRIKLQYLGFSEALKNLYRLVVKGIAFKTKIFLCRGITVLKST